MRGPPTFTLLSIWCMTSRARLLVFSANCRDRFDPRAKSQCRRKLWIPKRAFGFRQTRPARHAGSRAARTNGARKPRTELPRDRHSFGSRSSPIDRRLRFVAGMANFRDLIHIRACQEMPSCEPFFRLYDRYNCHKRLDKARFANRQILTYLFNGECN